MTFLLRCKLFCELVWRYNWTGFRTPARHAWAVARIVYPKERV